MIAFTFGHDIIHFSEFLQGLHLRHSRHGVDGVPCRLSNKRSGTPLAVNVLLDCAKCGATDITELQGQIESHNPDSSRSLGGQIWRILMGSVQKVMSRSHFVSLDETWTCPYTMGIG